MKKRKQYKKVNKMSATIGFGIEVLNISHDLTPEEEKRDLDDALAELVQVQQGNFTRWEDLKREIA
jgi:translation elongation factor EF-1beta